MRDPKEAAARCIEICEGKPAMADAYLLGMLRIVLDSITTDCKYLDYTSAEYAAYALEVIAIVDSHFNKRAA